MALDGLGQSQNSWLSSLLENPHYYLSVLSPLCHSHPYILSSLYYETTITRHMSEHFHHFSVLYVSQIPPHPLQIFIFLDSLFRDYFSVLPVHLCLNFLTYTFFYFINIFNFHDF